MSRSNTRSYPMSMAGTSRMHRKCRLGDRSGTAVGNGCLTQTLARTVTVGTPLTFLRHTCRTNERGPIAQNAIRVGFARRSRTAVRNVCLTEHRRVRGSAGEAGSVAPNPWAVSCDNWAQTGAAPWTTGPTAVGSAGDVPFRPLFRRRLSPACRRSHPRHGGRCPRRQHPRPRPGTERRSVRVHRLHSATTMMTE